MDIHEAQTGIGSLIERANVLIPRLEELVHHLEELAVPRASALPVRSGLRVVPRHRPSQEGVHPGPP